MVKRIATQMFSSTPSVASEPNLKKGRGTETSWAQKAAIMEWLELAPGDNFRLITGAEFLILNGIMFSFRLITGSATSKLIGVVAVQAICVCRSCRFCESTLREQLGFQNFNE